MDKEKVFAIFGLGTFGYEVCSNLVAKGAKVIAVDHSEKLVDKIKDLVTQAIVLDSTDEELFNTLPFDDIDVAVVAMGDNIEASILTTSMLKNAGVPHIISRAITDTHAHVLKQVGANEVINLEVEAGEKIANKLFSPFVYEELYLSKNQILAEISVPNKHIGKSIKELDLRKTRSINIVSIKRTITNIDHDGNPVKTEIIVSPMPVDILEKDDILIVVGASKDIEDFREK